jgi:hypothetical protein
MDFEKLSNQGFKQVFESINKHGIKDSVDGMGIDKFIDHCAELAALTGVGTGLGGAVTTFVGLPVDVINNITQQFRVTLGVIYYRKGTYSIGFEEFMTIVAMSIGVEVGVVLTRVVLVNIAKSLLLRMGVKSIGRLIPFVGALVGGVTNYAFIQGIGKSMKSLNL